MSGPDAHSGFLCMGASAGGLRSLEVVLSKLPTSYPWPILVSQHLQREHASLMPEILARATKLPVREARHDETPLPGHVYTCPSTAELGVSPEGRLALRAPVEGRPQRIDHLFSTASFAKPNLVVAVILSGTGNDGTAGSLVVKLNGGTVIAESDASAQQPGMPRAAAKAGTVDATLPADAIAALAIELAEGGLEETTQRTTREIGEIAKTLAKSSGTDFTRYRTATLRRRVEKRRALVGAASTEAYHALVERDDAERAALIKSLLLPVTEFFRDPPAWDALAHDIIPALVQRARAGETVRVWCAGCASGEEAYSMAMTLAEAGAPLDRVQVFGTDLDPDSIGRAKIGTYDEARTQNVSPERRARFFTADDGAYRVKSEIRAAVTFREHDLTREAPHDAPFDIIACRNVLIYFDETLQAKVIHTFERSLTPRGILFLGRSTTLPPRSDAFEPVARTMRIFRRRQAPTTNEPSATARAHAAPAFAAKRAPAIDALLVEDSSAVVLVVDEAWRVTEANRRAREDVGASIVGQDLLDVFPRWQGSPVHDALRAVMGTGRSVRVQGVPMGGGFVDLLLETLPHAGARKLLLVANSTETKLPGKAPREDQQLREDLAATNDELQTANEELAATNEELQATNEELASLNEEFASTNQNLAASNAGMQANAADARAPGDLLHAVLRSRGDAVIACDASRIVTLVTPRAAALFHQAPALGATLDAKTLGVANETLDDWFSRSERSASPIGVNVARSQGDLRLTLEVIRGSGGARLGWLLTLSAPDEHLRADQGA